jgi:hypothetical protein
MSPSHSIIDSEALWQATLAIHRSGIPLMSRILPDQGELKSWQHYPPRDVVNGIWRARWFYHCHNPDDRTGGEHGHFHFFLGRPAFSRRVRPLAVPPQGRKPRPSIVHIAALSIDFDGLPVSWFVTDRWVTDEWLYPAQAISEKLGQISFSGDDGDRLVNDWLGAMIRASRTTIGALLAERDRILALRDPSGEAREIEIVAQEPIDFDLLLNA